MVSFKRIKKGMANLVVGRYPGARKSSTAVRKTVVVARPVPMRPGGFLTGKSRAAGAAPELFSVDTAQADYVCDTTGSVTLLNGIAQGDDINNRHGRRVQLKAVHVCGVIKPIDDTTVANVSRVMLVFDKQCNGAALTIADVLTSVSGTSYNKLDNRDRFVVLADYKYALGGMNTTATQTYGASPSCFKVDIHRKINLPVTFIGTTNAIASIQSGSLYLITVGTAAPNAGGQFQAATARVRYTDI